MMFRNASHAFLALLPVKDLKPPHWVIALRNANRYMALANMFPWVVEK
jgi:hypothetical protein